MGFEPFTKQSYRFVVALAGQPNCGKSTVFNALTGARQHVANWPGVTVEKVSGWRIIAGRRVEIVDLPGTYSLASFSPDERVARDFLLHGSPSLVVNVIDAANVKQGLTLTLQLLEMRVPLIINLNMMDVARKSGMAIDTAVLERLLGVPVVPTSMRKGKQGERDLLNAISASLQAHATGPALRIDYGFMEPFLRQLEHALSNSGADRGEHPFRWAAVKLMEGNEEGLEIVQGILGDVPQISIAEDCRRVFENRTGETPEIHIGRSRLLLADTIATSCVRRLAPAAHSLSDRIDGIVCHRFAGPAILVAVMYLLYYLSIIQGYKVTSYTWPLLAGIRSLAEGFLPMPRFIEIPLIRSFSLWFIDSINALLNYVPIFCILFALIAVLEDSGYMPRMAFIMDRILHLFGLHGQSILPMVLGGVYVGGCAVPAVMSCKGIPDERSRMATILTIPMLNCMAKVPLYVLLITAYFAANKGFAMFFISTISLLLLLPVAKILSLTVLRTKETAPFLMEMPAYHIPAIRTILIKTAERVWLFLRKIVTIVAGVAVVIFALLQFPGLSAERTAYYEDKKNALIRDFYRAAASASHFVPLKNEDIMPLIHYWDAYKKAKMAAGESGVAVNRAFQLNNPRFFRIVQPGNDPEATKVNRAARGLVRGREGLLLDMKKERLENSFLGRFGKKLESLTAWAGFDWRIDVALLSALAAKESSVATLGAIYGQNESQESLEERMAAEKTGLSPLHALALIVFMVLYPPCIATAIAVKVQTGSVGWMLFTMGYPIFLGLVSAMLVFSGGRALGLSGIQAMYAFYGLALVFTLLAAVIKLKTGPQGLLESHQKEGLQP